MCPKPFNSVPKHKMGDRKSGYGKNKQNTLIVFLLRYALSEE